MPRFVDLEGQEGLSSDLRIGLGDVVAANASGCIVEPEDGPVEMLGIFNHAIVSQGEPLAPEGGPNLVLLRGRSAGAADVQFVKGDPFGSPQRVPMRITVSG
nr:hypothetical protein [uncultured Sphingosinicella sp.]